MRTLEIKGLIDEGSRKGTEKKRNERENKDEESGKEVLLRVPYLAKDIQRSSRAWTPLFTITLSQAWAMGTSAIGQGWIS